MTGLLQDIRYALRQLRKSPGFTAIAVATLALGIGANTAIFSFIYGALLAHLPYRHPEQLVNVWSSYHGHRNNASVADFLDWKRQSTVFESLNAFEFINVSLATNSGPPESALIARETPDIHRMEGVPIVLGRDFSSDEGSLGKNYVVIISNKCWRHRFNGDPNVLGRKIQVNGEAYTIIGVLGPPPAEGQEGDDWVEIPLVFRPDEINRYDHWLTVEGRLKPGVTIEQATAEMQTIARQIAQANPSTNKYLSVLLVRREHAWVAPRLRRTLYLLMGAVGFVLLIACANVANLLLARGTVRRREIAIRSSLGATRWRLITQFLTESVILASLGAALGAALAWSLLKIAMVLMPLNQLPSEAVVKLQAPVLLFAFGVASLSAILCGSAPAMQSGRVDLIETLKDGTRSATGIGGRGLRRLLVVGEFALALTLLTAAGLAMHGFWKAESVDLGFQPGHILTFKLQLQQERKQGRLQTPEQITAFYRLLLAKLESVPGVLDAEASLTRQGLRPELRTSVTIAGRSLSDAGAKVYSNCVAVTPQFFKTFGIRIERGRAFTEEDREGSQLVAVVNEAFVRQFLPGIELLGQRVIVPQPLPNSARPPVELEIVGVYRDARNDGLNTPQPEIDVPFWQNPWPYPMVAVRTSGDPQLIRQSIASVIQSIAPDAPMAEVQTMDDTVREFSASERFGAVLFGSFGAAGLILAALGIYGVVAFGVAERTREIGLRVAMGAGREQVVLLFLREALVLALTGLGFGVAGAYTAAQLMRGMWYGVQSSDPFVFAAVGIGLLSFALLGSYIPARRAARVDPMVALRYE